MRVLMLGWEFPPYISGGLGTACYGLTRALGRYPVTILFLLPQSDRPPGSPGEGPEQGVAGAGKPAPGATTFVPIRSDLLNPYQPTVPVAESPAPAAGKKVRSRPRAPLPGVRVIGSGAEGGYGGDLLGKIQTYTEECLDWSRSEPFDLVHAHDWITFPAAAAIAREHRKPLIVHVHATEFDRAGDLRNPSVYDMERQGMHAATRIIAVSGRTKRTITEHYDVPPDKVTVVYNGIDFGKGPDPDSRSRGAGKTVLFLGRITMQKGPEYFVRAASRVAEQLPGVRFVIAGAGDLLPKVARLVEDLGLGEKVEFAGFLRGKAVDRAFRQADVYVMPSVSEPFGLTALEATRHGVPIIISRSSGVGEVLQRGALSVDFWDVNLMARMIIAVLRYPTLAARIRKYGAAEARTLTWEVAAKKCMALYHDVLAQDGHSGPAGPTTGVGA